MPNTPTTRTTTTNTEQLPYPALNADDGWGLDPRGYPESTAWIDARASRRDEHLAPLWEMTVEQRIAAMRRGELTMTQLCRWASRYPEQVPTINCEFEFIAAFTPEAAEA